MTLDRQRKNRYIIECTLKLCIDVLHPLARREATHAPSEDSLCAQNGCGLPSQSAPGSQKNAHVGDCTGNERECTCR